MCTYKLRGSETEGFFYGLYDDDGGLILSGGRRAVFADALRAVESLRAALREGERFETQAFEDGQGTFTVRGPGGRVIARSHQFETPEARRAAMKRVRSAGRDDAAARLVDESNAARGFVPMVSRAGSLTA